VGRTTNVSGGMVISGTEVTAADFSVDLKSIKSDQGARDVQFNGFIMKTYDYPTATFRLTEPIQLGSIPPIGQQIHQTATGNLHMRGITQPVTFTLEAERLGNTIEVNAEIPIVFSRWHIPNPSFAVAQVGNTGTLEVLLRLIPVDIIGSNASQPANN
jgi:polyisoprenoid-binding protein YceI